MSELPFQSGALIDNRPEEEKIKDFKFSEGVASINEVNWVEKSPEKWRKFPIFNQSISGSCVAQTIAKLLGIMYSLVNDTYVHFSATHIYQRRYNKPSPGMLGVDAFNIARESVTLEELVPSQGMSDSEMDNIIIPSYKNDVGKIFKISNYLELPTKDIDAIASIIQTTGKGVMIWVYFTMNEWNQPVPEIRDHSLQLIGAPGLHSVPVVDFTLYQGKKALIIEDSWGISAGINGQRIITEDFYKERNWYAAYPINFKFAEGSVEKPKYNFTTPLYFGLKNNKDVVALQDILKYEGLFPLNQSSTGNYGAMTASGVYQYQVKYNIATIEELNNISINGIIVKGGKVGVKTMADLNKRYK